MRWAAGRVSGVGSKGVGTASYSPVVDDSSVKRVESIRHRQHTRLVGCGPGRSCRWFMMGATLGKRPRLTIIDMQNLLGAFDRRDPKRQV
jgi:hypothetical protein